MELSNVEDIADAQVIVADGLQHVARAGPRSDNMSSH